MINTLDPTTTAQLTAEIANYKEVMTNFGVPEDKLFVTLALSKSELDSFFADNPGITDVRIYISKKTDDPDQADDYKLNFVPCGEVTDPNGTYYQDKLTIAPGEPSKIIMAACRIPPGCKFGAAFIPG